MSNHDRTNTGIVSKNDRKQQDNHPDITGTINVEGVEYFLDGWRKERNDGTGSFYSLRVKRKDKQPEAPKQQGSRGGYASASGAGSSLQGNALDDEIPFEMCWR